MSGTWVKVYDTLRGDHKSLMAGERAMWLFVCGLSYANEQTTDGFIAEVALPAVAPGVKRPERLAALLAACELWDRVGGGWQIRNYTAYQRSAQEIREIRADNADRQKRYRERKRDERNAGVTRNAPSTVTTNTETDTYTETDTETEQTSTPTSATPTDDFAVLNAWVVSTGKTAQTVLSPKRRKIIKAALKDYPLADVIDAVDGWRFSPHHRGENEQRTVYNGIELLLRDGAQIEKFRDLKRTGNVTPISSMRRDGRQQLTPAEQEALDKGGLDAFNLERRGQPWRQLLGGQPTEGAA